MTTPSERDGLEEAIGRFVRALRHGLHASTAQEKTFEAAVTRLRDATEEFRGRMNQARNDIARAVRSDAFDEAAFEAASRRVEEAFAVMRAAAREALVDVHDALDERQRAILGNLIESRPIG